MTPHLLAIRFGTGLSPATPPPAGPEALLAELTDDDPAVRAFPLPLWSERMADIQRYSEARQALRDAEGSKAADEAFKVQRRLMRERYNRDLAVTLARASAAPLGFRERLVWFWADHFSVVDGHGILRRSAIAYHDAALRPRLAGRFADLLYVAITHPAMVAYLDQARSIGPNSLRGRRGGGLNENLAREVLELHTLGVDGPYGQGDVQQLAELLTGLTVTRDGLPSFNPSFVEPGAEVVLGRSYGGGPANWADIRAVLNDLSVHPATAHHLSRKLATHFIADQPPTDLVEAMTETWRRTDGDLTAVYGTMLTHPAATLPDLQKVRRPLDLVAAAARATGQGVALAEAPIRAIREIATQPMDHMGQRWLVPPGPQGWPEEAEAWITPQGLAARLDWALSLGRQINLDPRAFLEAAIGPLASPRTRFAVEAAEERAAGIALVLAAPEFQRR